MRSLIPLALLAVTLALGGCAHSAPDGKVIPQTPTPVSSTSQGPTSLNQSDRLVPMVRFTPPYPASVQIQNIQGCIGVWFDVNPQGRPVHIKVRTSTLTGALDQAVTTAIKRWKFWPPTKNGTPAWGYNVYQTISFKLDGAPPKEQQKFNWLCDQPSAQAVLVRPALPASANDAVIASYGDETIAYLPGSEAPQPGSAKLRFCVDKRGNVTDTDILRATPDPRYGPLAVAIMQARSFAPFMFDGSPQKICRLTWSLPFVTAPPDQRPPICGCRGDTFKIVMLPAASLVQTAQGANPVSAVAAVAKGKAKASLCIGADGSVTGVKINAGSGDPQLDSLALGVLRDFRFFAQRDDAGNPIPSCGWQIAVKFETATKG
ncbi:MAG: TonB family protein [Gammaproteobacteria bacterium]